MIGPVIKFTFDNKITVGIKAFQPDKDSIMLFKACISPAVDTKRQKPAFFQKLQRRRKSGHTCFYPCRYGMIPTWKIAEVKYNAADCIWGCICFHVGMGIQDAFAVLKGTFFQKLFLCVIQGVPLDIKGKYMACTSAKPGKKKGH